jgi:hypothetical protein
VGVALAAASCTCSRHSTPHTSGHSCSCKCAHDTAHTHTYRQVLRFVETQTRQIARLRGTEPQSLTAVLARRQTLRNRVQSRAETHIQQPIGLVQRYEAHTINHTYMGCTCRGLKGLPEWGVEGGDLLHVLEQPAGRVWANSGVQRMRHSFSTVGIGNARVLPLPTHSREEYKQRRKVGEGGMEEGAGEPKTRRRKKERRSLRRARSVPAPKRSSHERVRNSGALNVGQL